MRHVVIIPARNESAHLRQTLLSCLTQTEPPDRLYVVDDGSTDDTAAIAEDVARAHPSVVLLRRPDEGRRRMGGGVVDTFNTAYAQCRGEDFTYISKIDADQILPPNYFEVLLGHLDANPAFAALCGTMYERIGGKLVRLRMPDSHVLGSMKTMRKAVFDRMGGFVPVLGWDIIDLVKMRSMGYRTGHLKELKVVHMRQHGTAEGALPGRVKWGEGAYVIGSHPLFVVARGLYRMLEPPYVIGGLAMWWGYLRAVARGAGQIDDTELKRALRAEQLHRLLHGNRLAQDIAARRT